MQLLRKTSRIQQVVRETDLERYNDIKYNFHLRKRALIMFITGLIPLEDKMTHNLLEINTEWGPDPFGTDLKHINSDQSRLRYYVPLNTLHLTKWRIHIGISIRIYLFSEFNRNQMNHCTANFSYWRHAAKVSIVKCNCPSRSFCVHRWQT